MRDAVCRRQAVTPEDVARMSFRTGFASAVSPVVAWVRFACSGCVSGYAGRSFHDFFEAEKRVER